jgi:hypothetical protein
MVVSDTNGGCRYNFSNNIPTRYHTKASNGAYINVLFTLSYGTCREYRRIKDEQVHGLRCRKSLRTYQVPERPRGAKWRERFCILIVRLGVASTPNQEVFR